MRAGFPIATRGMVIGLLGGSFDPAHEGHVHITREALKRMGLDQVWWLVTPGNPLKARQPAPMGDRLARAKAVMQHSRVKVTALEKAFGTRATVETIERLQKHYPGVIFVWLMGADNLVQFHQWERWRDILRSVAVGVLARPQAPGLGLCEPAVERRLFVRNPGEGGVAIGAVGDAPRSTASSRRGRATGSGHLVGAPQARPAGQGLVCPTGGIGETAAISGETGEFRCFHGG